LTVFRRAVRWQLLISTVAGVLLAPAVVQASPTFLAAINISPAGGDAFEPKVAIAPDGTVISVWTRSDGTNFRIQSANRTPSGAWTTTPQTISDPGVSASGPALAIDSSGNALAVWTQSDGSNLRITAAFKPAGSAFGVPTFVSAAGQDASAPDVSMDSSGDALVGWQRTDGTNLRVQAAIRSPGAGGTFGQISTLSDPGQDGFEPKVAAGPNVDVNGVAVWTRSDGVNLRVQSARRRDVTGFPRPKGASPVRAQFVPAFNNCSVGSANRTHGPPFAVPSCSPPVQSSSVLTIGAPDANGAAANFAGYARYVVIAGNSATEADEADVKLLVSLSDIRNKPALTDYVGKVLVTTDIQITDNSNSPEAPEPGTTQVSKYQFPVDCVSTISTTIGSTCNINTTADAIVPGTVTEGRRAVWQMGQVEVKDAGPNGTGYASCPPTCGDGDETVFLRQGYFVP
jgi:hypothetical protein